MKKIKLLWLPLACCLLTDNILAQQLTVEDRVATYRHQNEQKIIKEFLSFLAIPNVASDHANIKLNADFIINMMKDRGLNPRLLETTNAPPAVYAEWRTPGASRTILFYAHYDGQPTDPKQWSGTRPWEPTFRSAPIEKGGQIIQPPESLDPELRIYARSASDDKAGVLVILNAFAALKNSDIALTSNIKFLFEGEEEAGSPHLGEIIDRNKDLLAADAWIICDGPVHQSGQKQVVFGARGDLNVDLTVYGATRPLHSGHYGNWSPNPAMILARLLATMKDDGGHVTIAGWYDDAEPLGQLELAAIAASPKYDSELKKQLGLAHTDGGTKSLMELINEPSLNINGFSSGDVGPLARNVIPTTANTVLDLRLVKGNDYQRQFQKLKSHITKQGFEVIDHDPTNAERLKFPLISKLVARAGGYNADRTRMDLALSKSVIGAVQATTKGQVVLLPTSGGSLPLSIITSRLKTVTISVPIANYDNNQHAENENLRLQNLWDGIDTYASLMTLRP